MADQNKASFEQAASEHAQSGFLSEMWQFLKHRKKWWMIPIVVLLLLFGLLIFLSGTGVAPFIYTLF